MKTYVRRITRLFAAMLSFVFVFCAFLACTPPEPEPIVIETDVKVMSFNIRVGEQTDKRRAAVIDTIEEIDPDVFGVQEADPAWIAYLVKQLPDYTLVGEGRDGGEKGEYAAIFYRAEKYELIQGGTKWLSLTPDTPSILDGGSQYKRVVTYAKLKDKQTGGVFVHLNAHLDYSSDEIARQQANIITEYARLFRAYPTFITGDFNQIPDSATYQQMLDGGFYDSVDLALEGEAVGTFNDYSKNVAKHKRIDYCFISQPNVYISTYNTWNKEAENGGHNGFISDHYAVYVESTVTNVGLPSTAAETLNTAMFQCGDKTYGDVSFNSYGLGASCTFAENTLMLTVAKGETLALEGVKTAKDVSLYVAGEGTLVIDGDVTAKEFAFADTVTVTVNGKVNG